MGRKRHSSGSPQILVIGGGISGHIAAIELAGRGAQVTLVDGNDRMGGRWYSPNSGAWLPEPGLHLIHGKGPLSRSLLRANKSHLPFVPIDIESTEVINGKRITAIPRRLSTAVDAGLNRIQAAAWFVGWKRTQKAGQIHPSLCHGNDNICGDWVSALSLLTNYSPALSLDPLAISTRVRRGCMLNRLWIPVGGTNAILSRLAIATNLLNVSRQSSLRVLRIEQKGMAWLVHFKNGQSLNFDGILLSLPSSSTMRLLKNSGYASNLSHPSNSRRVVIRSIGGKTRLLGSSSIRIDIGLNLIAAELGAIDKSRIPKDESSLVEIVVCLNPNESEDEGQRRIDHFLNKIQGHNPQMELSSKALTIDSGTIEGDHPPFRHFAATAFEDAPGELLSDAAAARALFAAQRLSSSFFI